jgi:hypothetical protein
MLKPLSQGHRDCLKRAAESRARAESTSDKQTKRMFLDMEQKWLRLAQSYEYVERLQKFLDSRQPVPRNRRSDP